MYSPGKRASNDAFTFLGYNPKKGYSIRRSDMKALSMRPAEAIQVALEDINSVQRAFGSDYRGPVLICSNKTNPVNGTIPGNAVCVASLADINQTGDKEYDWNFEDIRLIRPVEVKCKQRLFEAPVEEKDLIVCTATDVDEAAEWLKENFLPFIKGAKKLSEDEWEVAWPFEL